MGGLKPEDAKKRIETIFVPFSRQLLLSLKPEDAKKRIETDRHARIPPRMLRMV